MSELVHGPKNYSISNSRIRAINSNSGYRAQCPRRNISIFNITKLVFSPQVCYINQDVPNWDLLVRLECS